MKFDVQVTVHRDKFS